MDRLLLVESGLVELLTACPGQSEVSLGMRSVGSLLGTSVMNEGKHDSTALTLTACEFRQIAARDFLGLVNTDPAVNQWTLRMLTREQRQQIAHRKRLGQPAIERLCEVVVDLARYSGVRLTDGGVRFAFPPGNRTASLVAVSRQEVYKLLRAVEAKGTLGRAGGGWWIIPPTSTLLALISGDHG